MTWPTKNSPEVIECVEPALRAFIRGYLLFVLLFQACADSLANENTCRLAAMRRAEKNIEDTLEDLNRTFHRMRQGSIDEELFDDLRLRSAVKRKSASKRGMSAQRQIIKTESSEKAESIRCAEQSIFCDEE